MRLVKNQYSHALPFKYDDITVDHNRDVTMRLFAYGLGKPVLPLTKVNVDQDVGNVLLEEETRENFALLALGCSAIINYMLTSKRYASPEMCITCYMNIMHVRKCGLSCCLFVIHLMTWATTQQNVSSGVSDQARHKPACAATEAS